MNNKNYTTTAASALTAMLNKIAGLVMVSESDDPEYYDSLSCTAMMLSNGIKMLEKDDTYPMFISHHDEDFEPCNGDCENCELDCGLDDDGE